MDTDRLRYFIVLCNSSSMKEAADHIHISQPALSKAMKQLENELGVQLFVHSGRRLIVTDKGHAIAAKAQNVLNDLENILEDSNGGREPRIRIGSFEVFTTYFMGQLSSHELKDFNVQIREATPGHLEEQISNGNIDIGITYLPIPNPSLDYIKVNDIEMGIFGVDGKFKKLRFDELPFAIPITPVQGVPHKVKGLDGWPDDRIPRKVQFQVELMETALELCRQGLAVAYFPRFVVNLHNLQVRSQFALHMLPPPSGLKTTKQGVYIIKRKSDVEHPIFRRIAKALRNL